MLSFEVFIGEFDQGEAGSFLAEDQHVQRHELVWGICATQDIQDADMLYAAVWRDGQEQVRKGSVYM